MNWKSEISRAVGASLNRVENVADAAWHRFSQRMGLNEPRQIVAYRGYGNSERVWVQGRLLANRLRGGPKEDDRWWENLAASYQRWESDEVPGEEIHLRYGSADTTVTTDAEGYYFADFARGEAGEVTATHTGEDRILTATHTLTLPDPDARFMVISDVDDTVIRTGITDLVLAAQLTFLNNAKTRKPLAGAASLYRALNGGSAGDGANPMFYLSNSAWNMYDLLRDFLDLNEFPAGPLLLRDLGLGTDSSDHKIEALERLLARFDHLPAVLIGDSGQHDAEIYARVAQSHPGRIAAIYIRDIDPDGDSPFDRKVDGFIAGAGALEVPFLRVGDSIAVAQHAAKIGLLAPDAVVDVVRDVEADANRSDV